MILFAFQPQLDGAAIPRRRLDERRRVRLHGRRVCLCVCKCLKSLTDNLLLLNSGLWQNFLLTGLLSCHHTAVGFSGTHASRLPDLQSLHEQQQRRATSLEAPPVQSFQCVGWSSGLSVQPGESHTFSVSLSSLENQDTGFWLDLPFRVWTPGTLRPQSFWKLY